MSILQSDSVTSRVFLSLSHRALSLSLSLSRALLFLVAEFRPQAPTPLITRQRNGKILSILEFFEMGFWFVRESSKIEAAIPFSESPAIFSLLPFLIVHIATINTAL